MGLGQIFLSIIAVVTLGIGVYLNQKDTENFIAQEVQAPQTQVLSESDESSPSPTATPSPSPHSVDMNMASPTPQPVQINQSTWFYPSAQITNTSSSKTTLISSDNPDTIVDWYKSKFKSQNLNVKTTVRTVTNDNYLAKLAGADSNLEVNIEVKKDSAATQTTISLQVIKD